ncbi:MAG: hypothetical protein Q8M43_04885 [Sulfuricurvum sp.]|uniref:hypothetical protein n=1 Tax=Sulfuricurvum sp. TaxID=2025608 RepID=UPI0027349CA1|nr:hypothetical protein [Sulfuricurvum sp.]MDP3291350.1 hypothetical protein [Sulfuricurvum sp.]
MIERFYRKIFIAIVQDGGSHDVRVVAQKQKKLLYKENRRFEGTSSYEDMVSFLRKYIDESPLYYVALLNPEPKQGALVGCSQHIADDMEEIIGTKTLCRNGKWLLYSSQRELDALEHQYRTLGLDFIFSPFSILEHFFADKIKGGFALYALAQKNSFSIVLFEEGKLEYAHHYTMTEKSGMGIEDESNTAGFAVGIKEEEEIERGISLDDIESLDDLDILEELDDLSDIEDLDTLEEIAEFSEDELTYEEKRITSSHGNDIKSEMDRFNNDYRRFELIQRTLIRFYGGEHCRNRFVETVYIADAYGSGSELKRYLEEELFLNVLIRHIDVADEVIALSMVEEEGL